MATIRYSAGDRVTYPHELPYEQFTNRSCGQVTHQGTVTGVAPDASGDQVVIVAFDCGVSQEILASELHPAG